MTFPGQASSSCVGKCIGSNKSKTKQWDVAAQTKHSPRLTVIVSYVGASHISSGQRCIGIMWGGWWTEHRFPSHRANPAKIAGPSDQSYVQKGNLLEKQDLIWAFLFLSISSLNTGAGRASR